MSFTFIDLFAGIGGLRQGFEHIGGECIFTSEWDLACQKTYSENYNCGIDDINGDITQVQEKDIPKHDVLLAGFPCQPFSIAGVSKKNSIGSPHGFLCGTQGTLFFDVARIIAFHKPKVFLLENVKNLISHDKGNTFKTILKTLEEDLGYQVQYRVINSKSWVPQARQRIYIIGFKDTNNFDFESINFPNPDQGPKLKSILHPEKGSKDIFPLYTDEAKGKVLDKYTLSNKLWLYLQEHARKHKKKGNGFGFGINGPEDVSRTLSARYYKDGSEILIKQNKKNPRRLTPRECARLMGYNDSFKIVVSDTQAYKQFGNTVVVPVIKSIAEHLKPWIEKTKYN